MKQKLHFLLLFVLVTWQGFSQATATQPPPMIYCNLEVFDLTTQTPLILGAQNPANFTVTYYTSAADAQNESNPIANPTFFIAPQSQPVTIYARVDSLLDTSFAMTDFFVMWDSAWVPQMPDVTACDSYTLPTLPSGNYFILPNGTGAQLSAGDAITVNATIYVFATSQSGTCTNETSFEVTILPTTELLPVADVYSCQPYELPALEPGLTYQMNGMVISLPATISQTSDVTISSGSNPCGGATSFTVYIGTPNITEITQYVICNNDGNGFGVFDLNSQFAAISNGIPGLNLFFHETLADVQTASNPISNPGNYVNINPNTQMLYVRAVLDNQESCYAVGTLNLVVTSCTENTISGNIRFDYDNNGCTVNDPAGSTVVVSCTNGNFIDYAYADANGNYTFTNIQQGNNLVTPLTVPMNFTVAAPSSQTFNVLGNTNALTADFCLILANPVNDAAVFLYPTNGARPGFAATYILYVQNVGSTMISGSATVTFDAGKLVFANANPAQTSQTGNTFTFIYNNLMPFQAQYYNLTFNVFTPPTVNAGDILAFSAGTTTGVTDANLANNEFAFNQTVVNSYDPNDITVLEGAYISETQADGYLNYVVRFQNTGNADAVNVRVTNKLDPNLDWATFQPMASSHVVQSERSGDDVTFTFNGINLPGSVANEVASHGFFTYKIKPKPDFSIGEIIYSSASIFFDFNAPIITNTVTTQIQSLGVSNPGFNDLRVYPNPASDRIAIQCDEISELQVAILDLQGKVVIAVRPEILGGTGWIDVSRLQSGMYFVRLVSGDQSVTKKLIVE